MAVYSPISFEDISLFLEQYNIGILEKYEGILEGIENTNYYLIVNKKKYILNTLQVKILMIIISQIRFYREKGRF